MCPVLNSFTEQDVEKRAPITVKYEIPYFTVSGIQVRYLKIVEKSGYQALPWVRYITQNGDDYRYTFIPIHLFVVNVVAACGQHMRKGVHLLDSLLRLLYNYLFMKRLTSLVPCNTNFSQRVYFWAFDSKPLQTGGTR
jgi:hypothetical protein